MSNEIEVGETGQELEQSGDQPWPAPVARDGGLVAPIVAQAGSAVGRKAVARAEDAARVIDVIERTHTKQTGLATSPRKAIKAVAEKVKAKSVEAAQEGRHAGGMEQLKGHFIERLDNDTYNAKNVLTGKKLVSMAKSNAEAYDAKRFINGDFAGGVQQKSSAGHVEKTIKAMEKKKPGSARKGVLRVPKDQAATARRKAAGRVKEVKGMDFTLDQATGRLEQGVSDVASKGTRAASKTLALGKAGAVSAATRAAFGALGDIPALRRGQISTRDFAENRALDAVEGGTAAIVGTLASGAGAAGTTALLGTATGATFAASVGAAGTSALTTISGMGAAGTALAGAAGGITATAALPAVVGFGVAAGTGIVVTKTFKRVHRVVRARQDRRRELEPASVACQLEAAKADGEGTVVLELELWGSADFAPNAIAKVRSLLRTGSEEPATRPTATRSLRKIGFYISDWVVHGGWLTSDQFDALVDGGLITIRGT